MSRQLDFKRDTLLSINIMFNGHSIQTSQRSLQLISSKVTSFEIAINNNIAIPQDLLFWRDSENTNIIFNSAQEMLTWLKNLYIAINMREGKIYEISFNKKDEINSKTLNDLEFLLNYDINQGWEITTT